MEETTPPSTLSEDVAPGRRNHYWAFLVLGLCLAALVGLVLYLWFGYHPIRPGSGGGPSSSGNSSNAPFSGFSPSSPRPPSSVPSSSRPPSSVPSSGLPPSSVPSSGLPPSSLPPQNATFRVQNSCSVPVWIEARATLPNPAWSNPSAGQFSTDPNQWFAGAPLDFNSPGAPPAISFETPPQLNPGDYLDIPVQQKMPWGVAGGRIWAKVGCDANGTNCTVGDSSQAWGGWSNPNGGCPIPSPSAPNASNGCLPPFDTALEFTTGCSLEEGCSPNPSNWAETLGGLTYYDVSHVNGYTLPYNLTLVGGGGSACNCDAATGQCAGAQNIDGSRLSLGNCPTADDLSLPGTPYAQTSPVPATVDPATGQPYDLSAVNLRYMDAAGQNILACFAPQTKLVYGPPYGINQTLSTGDAAGRPLSIPSVAMACPTPPQYLCTDASQIGGPCPGDPTGVCQSNMVCSTCTFDNGCTSSATCNQGPGPIGGGPSPPGGDGVTATQYVQGIHAMVPGVYAFAYDDAVGLSSCPTDVSYLLELCPTGSPPYPAPVSPSS